MSEELTIPILNTQTGSSTPVTFFTDDTIDTIQYRIGKVVGTHPDRLRIYVNGQFEGTYYSKDSRKWENLFLRMSPEGKIVQKGLEFYRSFREPRLDLDETAYDKSGWMALDSASETSFHELRLLGVPEERSWIYPLDNTTAPEHLPPASQVTIDIKSMFKTLHPYTTTQFVVIPYTTLVPKLEVLYYPRLRSGSPAVVPDDILKSVERQSAMISALTDLSVLRPEHVTISQVRWKLPLVNTDFGNAVRNRFEQIFYGTTLSTTTPVVSFFSSRSEQSRHKFFTENKEKTPHLDLRTWLYWWDATRPSKNKPALVFYRRPPGVPGSRSSFDRITVNSTEITISCSRTADSKLNHSELQKEVKEFLLSIDGLTAFLDPADYEDDRWEVQDMSAILHFSTELKQADFRRFDCLRDIYETADQDKLMFKFLRSDQSDTGLTDNQLRVLGLLKENEFTTPEDVHEQFPDLSAEECIILLQGVKQIVSDNPDIGERRYSLLPSFKFTAKEVGVTHAPDMKRVVGYISILREILMHPDNPGLDVVCPKRMETVEAEVATVPVSDISSDGDGDLGFLDDLLGELAGIGTSEKKEAVAEEPKQAKIVKSRTPTSLSTYFLTQLRDFDPVLYATDSPASKKCERTRQPAILRSDELARFDDEKLAEYDPRTEGRSKAMEVKDPDGLIVCPEYWCTIDRIPLKKDQLVDNTCPVCSGKVRSNDKAVEKTQDKTEFPVIQRDASSAFPGFVKYKSGTGNKQIPCCFTGSQEYKPMLANVAPKPAELFYVLGDTKSRLDGLRLAYVPQNIGKIAHLKLDYSTTIDSGNRIHSGNSGFFRAGIGRSSETLSKVLGMNVNVREPSENADIVQRCSFFRTWKLADSDENDKLDARVSSISKAFRENAMTPLEELEYSALVLNCMLYVLYVGSESVTTGCFMNIGAVRDVKRAVVVLVHADDPRSVDYLVHVSRTSATPVYNANIYKNPFPKTLVDDMETLRTRACVRSVPTIDKAIAFVNKTYKSRFMELKVILDPYRRAQALFLPGLFVLPFRPTSQIPTFLTEHVPSYSDIPQGQFPPKNAMIDILKHAEEVHPGYAYAHDSTDIHNNVVELITSAGLRIPVQSGDSLPDQDPTEITETIHEKTEDSLVYGKPDKDSVALSRSITYEAEIFEFLLYQLSKDIEHSDDSYYGRLRAVLSHTSPDVDTLRPLLHAWMDDTLTFSEAHEPPQFYSKMRHSCTGSPKDACTGLCAWVNNSCRVQVKEVRKTLKKDVLEKRLLSTLTSNDKIRNVVFNHRVSPFFSSVLYLELPSEVILSDKDVATQLKK
jgi:hypothetical protein